MNVLHVKIDGKYTTYLLTYLFMILTRGLRAHQAHLYMLFATGSDKSVKRLERIHYI